MQAVAGLEQTGGVEKDCLAAGAGENAKDSIARGLGFGSDDRQALLKERVEQSGLTGVGATDKGCVAAPDIAAADVESGSQRCRTSESESSGEEVGRLELVMLQISDVKLQASTRLQANAERLAAFLEAGTQGYFVANIFDAGLDRLSSRCVGGVAP